MTMLASPTIRGLDRLADLEGPVVFAANHHSHVDTPLMLSAIPEPWRHHIVIGAAADYFFGNRVTAPLSALVIGAIPIERNKVGRKSADDAAALIDDGWSMLIFPEGGRSPDGWGQPFRGGAAYLSLRCERAGRARPHRGHRPDPAQGPHRAAAVVDDDHLRRRRCVPTTARTRAASPPASRPRWPSWPTRPATTGGAPAVVPTPATRPSLQGPELGAWRRTWHARRPRAQAAPPVEAPLARPRLADAHARPVARRRREVVR